MSIRSWKRASLFVAKVLATSNAWECWRPTSGWRPVHTYVLLREGVGVEAFKEKLPAFLQRYMGAEIGRVMAEAESGAENG